ncbi:MAG: hypothetical protein H0U98_09115 [Alphaproteobacteria bacterium]|nr:hypothetical protein [Alphaproteobacteria bacterium]
MKCWALAVASLLSWMPIPALAQADRPLQAADNAKIAGEFTLLHEEFCLKAFPDDAAIEALALRRAGTVMTPEQLGARLHGEVGKGWLLKGERAEFAVMLETSQYHACSISVTTDGLLTPGPLYTILDGMYVGAQNLKIQPAVLTSKNTSTYYSTTITNPVANVDGSTTKHSFMLIKDYYRDGNKNLLRLDTRLVHQISP